MSKSSYIESITTTIAILLYILRPSVKAALSRLVRIQTSINTLVIDFLYPLGLLIFG